MPWQDMEICSRCAARSAMMGVSRLVYVLKVRIATRRMVGRVVVRTGCIRGGLGRSILEIMYLRGRKRRWPCIRSVIGVGAS